jgi:DNA mismatch repair protein PMS2
MNDQGDPVPGGLRRLSKGAVEKMLSRQALPTLSAIVKELVENSLDSGSSSVRVSMGEYGIDWVEVTDRGNGIDLESLKLMCRFGGTSKIDEYEDLHKGIEGFGFRGEGLAAIRVVSDIEVTSRARGSLQGYKAVYTCETENPVITEVNCPEGTTIKVLSPFLRDKVRRDDLIKGAKTLFRQIAETVQTYALIRAEIQFELHNYAGGRNNTVFSYLKASTVLGRLKEILGLAFEIGECEREASEVKLKVYLSTNLQSGSLKVSSVKKSELRMAVNMKPVDSPAFLRTAVDRIYTEYNPQGKYFVLLLLSVPPAWIDFNMSKDKREILLQNKEVIGKTITETMDGFLKDSQGVKMLRTSRPAGRESKDSQIADSSQKAEGNLLSFTGKKSTQFSFGSEVKESQKENSSQIEDEVDSPWLMRSYSRDWGKTNFDQDERTDQKEEVIAENFKHIDQNEGEILREMPISLVNWGEKPIQRNLKDESPSKREFKCSQTTRSIFLDQQTSEPNSALGSKSSSQRPSAAFQAESLDANDSRLTLQTFYPKRSGDFPLITSGSFSKPTKKILTDQGPVSIYPQFSDQYDHKCDHHQDQDVALTPEKKPIDQLRLSLLGRLKAEDLKGDQEKFLRKNFEELTVIGQFNKGFIICKWKDFDSRYFVIDQHAADEKANYEKLKRDLRVSTQALISPMVVDLSLTDFMVVEQNRGIFEDNGFKIKLESAEENNHFRVLIVGVPNVFYWRYDRSDFMDLLYLVANHAQFFDELMVPKAKREIATKACRSSIKIGDPLEQALMKEVVAKMSTLNHPWNCPHGRPSTIIADRIREPGLDRKLLKEKLRTII